MSDEECIRRRAHEIWEHEGRPEGRQEDHWAQACREIATKEDGTGFAAPPSSVDQDPASPPQMPMSGVLGGQFDGEGAANLSGGVGATLNQGSGAAGGDAGPLGGAGSAATHHPGIGASLTESPPRMGPASVPPDDAGTGIADSGLPHGPSAGDRGKSFSGGTATAKGDHLTEREAGLGAAGLSSDEAPGRITGRG
ncbi:DUF2934 domain-containing protein [Siccirubricoccus deserti]|uniref:DUF2934 domain-containing protein n=1 Tax=Siccirubricoccus deserti TaxID=2013562 RepID=A0A9X0UFV9_9PROT|nr:DUF2934 domain-containing protein [Siccirubricoccus deserti]MBC4019197.1 DUF2934 domain-containing protein [Siccirubricoccus deserti]